ncbi:quaternary ammonium compound efflux SMR transporter QacC, partial [Staphylococcus epidermidis]|nr:quaternary ammonium compound efflux SMR transporter QacC [Escherichia coli]MDH9081851.1 quaternary ammonium compound efflux SMR transporter QacC [Staphylococcus epidermidis]MDH9371295.1 quaternary ammonium compound efflux SMR transporter QacC [Staphylococcus epidermidis]
TIVSIVLIIVGVVSLNIFGTSH